MKNKFYKELLRRVCEDPYTGYGLCYYINKMHLWCRDNNIEWYCPYKYLNAVAPELWALKPNHNRDYWFARNTKGWEKRIAILEKIINENSKPRRKASHK